MSPKPLTAAALAALLLPALTSVEAVAGRGGFGVGYNFANAPWAGPGLGWPNTAWRGREAETNGKSAAPRQVEKAPAKPVRAIDKVVVKEKAPARPVEPAPLPARSKPKADQPALPVVAAVPAATALAEPARLEPVIEPSMPRTFAAPSMATSHLPAMPRPAAEPAHDPSLEPPVADLPAAYRTTGPDPHEPASAHQTAVDPITSGLPALTMPAAAPVVPAPPVIATSQSSEAAKPASAAPAASVSAAAAPQRPGLLESWLGLGAAATPAAPPAPAPAPQSTGQQLDPKLRQLLQRVTPPAKSQQPPVMAQKDE